MSSLLIHIVACIRIPFPFKGCIIFHCIYILLCLINSFIRGHFSYFHFVLIVTNADVNIGEQMFDTCFQFFVYIYRNGIAGSYNSVSFLMNLPTALYTHCHFAFLPAMHRSSRSSKFSGAHVIFGLFSFWIITTLKGMTYLIALLICIFLPNTAVYFSIYYLTMYHLWIDIHSSM